MDVAISINSNLKLLKNLVYIIIYAYMLIYDNVLKSLDCLENSYIDT